MLLRTALANVHEDRQQDRRDFKKFADLIATPGNLATGFQLPANCTLFASSSAILASSTPMVTIGDSALSTLRRQCAANDGAGATGMLNWTQTNPVKGSVSKLADQFVGADFGADSATCLWSSDATFTHNMYSRAVVTGLTGLDATALQGVICRSSSDLNTTRDFYVLYFQDDGLGTWSLSKWVNGSETVLDTGTDAIVNSDTIELEVSGSSLVGYLNGVSIATATDSALTTGLPGILLSAGQTLDNWQAGALYPMYVTLFGAAGAANKMHCYDGVESGRFIKKASGASGTISAYVADGFGVPVLIAQG